MTTNAAGTAAVEHANPEAVDSSALSEAAALVDSQLNFLKTAAESSLRVCLALEPDSRGGRDAGDHGRRAQGCGLRL